MDRCCELLRLLVVVVLITPARSHTRSNRVDDVVPAFPEGLDGAAVPDAKMQQALQLAARLAASPIVQECSAPPCATQDETEQDVNTHDSQQVIEPDDPQPEEQVRLKDAPHAIEQDVSAVQKQQRTEATVIEVPNLENIASTANQDSAQRVYDNAKQEDRERAKAIARQQREVQEKLLAEQERSEKQRLQQEQWQRDQAAQQHPQWEDSAVPTKVDEDGAELLYKAEVSLSGAANGISSEAARTVYDNANTERLERQKDEARRRKQAEDKLKADREHSQRMQARQAQLEKERAERIRTEVGRHLHAVEISCRPLNPCRTRAGRGEEAVLRWLDWTGLRLVHTQVSRGHVCERTVS